MRRLILVTSLIIGPTMAAFPLISCTGGGGSGGSCDPSFDEGCICEDDEGLACEPGPGCFCSLGEGADAGDDVAADDTGGTDTGGADTDNNLPGDTAVLTFTPKLGSNFKAQFDPSASVFIPEDTSSDRGDLVVLLCATDDAECLNPVVRAVDRTDPQQWPGAPDNVTPLQGSFGPDITVPGLPAGTYNAMVVYDSLDSQRRGMGYDEAFAGAEAAWGGVVSATDLMMASEEPTEGFNPPPTPVEVTLVAGETVALGDVFLSHYHELPISEPPLAGDGLLVVGNGVDDSLRLVDLATYQVLESSPGRFDFSLTGSDGLPIDGSLCNVIAGPGSSVYALFSSTGVNAGYATQWDVTSRTQVGHVVSFPQGNSTAGPCRAIWHHNGDQDYLFAVAAGGTNQGGQKGFWYANVTTLNTEDRSATNMLPGDDILFDKPLANVAAYRGQVFIGTETDELVECGGHACAFIADFDVSGHPTLRMDGGDRALYRGNLVRADVKLPELGNQIVACNDLEQGVPYFGLATARFKATGQDLLIFGGCHAIDMVDLATGEFLDFDAIEPGIQGLNAALFGGGFISFSLSPDGDTLWGVSVNKSRIAYSLAGNAPLGELGERRVSVDRHALMPIDLSAAVTGGMPTVSAAFATTDQDGFEGLPDDGINDLITPAIDPGIDIRGVYLKAFYLFWNISLSGELPNPFPVGPSIAVANGTVWLRGSGSGLGDQGLSALGQGSNLTVADLSTGRMVLWPQGDAPFYAPFLGLQTEVFGFDLTPARPTSISTVGLVFVP